jgi:gliding motility-associated-like protein
MNAKRSLVLIILSLLCWQGFTQGLSNRGKEFWVGYGHHQFMERLANGVAPNDMEMVLYFSAEQAATVTVTINGTTYSRTYNVPANGVIQSEFLPKAGTNDCRLYSDPPSSGGTGGEGIFDRGIHIVSNVPIVAYAHIFGNSSSGATMLMPVETWGYTYASINNFQRYADNCFSWIYVVAKENNTRVQIIPTVPTRNGRPANVPFTVDLQKGQIYQVVGASLGGGVGHELTGTRVTAIANASGQCYPIAVFAGSSRTSLGCTGTGSSGDNIMQQIFPFQAWGKKYLTAPTSNASSASSFMTNIYRVAVKDPSTVVKRNGVALTGLQRNFFYEFQSNTADFIEADKPIMVAQFMSSSGACPNTSGDGDPEMIYLSPLEQGVKRVGFFRNNRERISKNYLTLVIPTAGIASLKIDGSSTFSHTYAHPNMPGYSVVVRRWDVPLTGPPPGRCTVESDSAFTAITYGLGSVESYGYNAGTLINNLNAVGSIHNTLDPTASSHSFTCTNTPLELSVLMAYQPTKIVWKLSSIPELSPNADVTDNAPAPMGTAVFNGVTYYKYTLPGTYSFSQTGIYFVPLVTSHPSLENCTNTEEVGFYVEVKGKPKADFTYSHTGCAADTVYFTGQTPTSNGFSVSQWNWELPEAASGKDVKKKFSVGAQSVKLTVVSAEGCVGDTVRTINIFDKPIADFTVNPAAICEGGSVTFTDNSSNSGGGPVGSWYWDFGNGNTTNVTSNNPQSVTYNTYGNYTIKHVVKVSELCVSDTVTKVITVNARPRASFTYPAGCLPVDGIVQFTNATTIPDGQGISYSWNFGDPNATASNPNTSTLESPTHFYTTGNYQVKLTATSANGCVKDTMVNASFNMKPLLSYPALQSICENTPGAVSVAQASVTNAVPGTGIYKGPSVTGAGQFTPSTAGPGSHTIWYVFTSSAGCIDSVSQTISVYAKPQVDFTYPTGGCLPQSGLAQFTNGTTIADAQTLGYVWNFGDPNATAANPNTSTDVNPTHNFSNYGTYNISLSVTSSNGCTGSVSKTVTFSVKPALAYPALSAICESAAATSVATASVTNGVTGTGIYKGPGTSSTGGFDPAAAGSGDHTIWYVFTSAGGCIDSVSQTIRVHPRPAPSFTFTQGCLDVAGRMQFANTSTIPGGGNLAYAWNFGDANATTGNPNTSAIRNPSHSYSMEGTYNVSLSVTSANGCTAEKTVPVTVSKLPQLTYPALAAVCENAAPLSVATASVTNGVTGSGIYEGQGIVSATGQFDPKIAGNGNHTIRYIFTTTGGCKDTVEQTILVHPRPRPYFTYPAGCLPPNGQVQFTNMSAIVSNTPLTYAWNFGDPNATAANPNTSTVRHPIHSYSADGDYNVMLTASSVNGCTVDTTISVAVRKTPALSYPALTAMCENAAPVSVALATVTNGVSGTGVYSGPGVTAAGMFNPATAGSGLHTITYVFTSSRGCAETVTSTIRVHPKPQAAFTVNTDICVNGAATISSASVISSGSITTWDWSFGDNTTASYTNGNPFTKNYTAHNSYTISLTTTSDNGCVSDVASKVLKVHPLPVPDFTMPASVCMPNGSVAFTNTTTIAEPSTLGYQWSFGDGNTSTANSPAHVYASSGSYPVRLAVTSQYGCVQQVEKTFSSFYDKPIASFSVNADTLCEGTDNVFTDQSMAPNSTITSWDWKFDDGSTSTQKNPTKRYALPGRYDVELTVMNAVGCRSDVYTKEVIVYLQPVIDAGPSFVVPQGTVITFRPTANDSVNLSLQWSPAADFTNPGRLTQTLVAMRDQTYTLTAIGDGDCSASDFMTVKILKPVNVPNAFSPNGDGINDRWEIPNLLDYPGVTVEVFNRYGQKVFSSTGYSRSWDGTLNGSPLPLATYYYVINLKNGFPPVTGSVTIIR